MESIEVPELSAKAASLSFETNEVNIKSETPFNRNNNTFKRNGSEILLKSKYFNKIRNDKISKVKEEKKKRLIELFVKFVFYGVSNVMNVFLIGIYIYQTSIDEQIESPFISHLEFSCSLFFIFEYLLNYHRSKFKLKFVFSFESLIDYVTVIPVITNYLFSATTLELQFLRAFRIFRIFRVLRIYKSFLSIQSQDQNVESGEYSLNQLHWQVLNIGFVLTSYIFITTGIVLILQEYIPGSFNRKMFFSDAFYYVTTTFLTIGYGDIAPTNAYSRVMIILSLFLIVGILSDQFTKLSHLLNIIGPGIVRYESSNHILIVADKSICLPSLFSELRRIHSEDILVVTKDIEKMPSLEYPFNRTFILNVKSIDLDVLERANARNAKWILIFAEKSFFHSKQKEKLIDFILLKFMRLQVTAPICVQSLYQRDNYALNLKNSVTFSNNAVIPIFRLKSMMLAKASFNPGFLTFSQNLILNNYDSFADKTNTSDVNKNYMFGCENRIFIDEIPDIIKGLRFVDVIREVYLLSIRNYHVKVYTDSRELNRPILVIGIVDLYKQNKHRIKIFPINDKEPLDQKKHKLIYIANERAIFYWKNKPPKQIDRTQDVFNTFRNLIVGMADSGLVAVDQELKPRGAVMEVVQPDKPEEKDNRLLQIINELDKNFTERKSITKGKLDRNVDLKLGTKVNTTIDNLALIGEFESNDEGINILKQKIKETINRRYENSTKTFFGREEKEHLYAKRVINLENNSLEFNSHVIILGVQHDMTALIKMLIVHYRAREICIFSNLQEPNKEMIKLMKQFSTLYIFQGNVLDPNHLRKAGVDKCELVISLSEEEIGNNSFDDSLKLLSFRAIDYFFQTKVLIELQRDVSLKFLGNLPLDISKEIMNNEFLNPNFMSGNVIYINQLEKIIAQSVGNRKLETEAWMELMALGYFNKHTQLKKGSSLQNFPVIVTVDIPVEFHQKEYFSLITRLLTTNSPIMPLGLFIEEPLEDRRETDKGKVRSLSRKFTSFGNLRIMTSFKKKIGFSPFKSKEECFADMMKMNKKQINSSDFVDWQNNPMPTFITNPQPNYILNKSNKLMCLAFHSDAEFFRKQKKSFTKLKVKKLNFTSSDVVEIQQRFGKLFDSVKDRFENYCEKINREERRNERHVV